MEFQENNNQEEGNLGNDMESNDGRPQRTSMRTKHHSKSMGQQKRGKKEARVRREDKHPKQSYTTI
jgi:hypothetical protein